MSSGPACPIKDDQHVFDNHVVTANHENHSAFNGGRRTPSRYSEVMCISTGLRWRTKARYVGRLPIATTDSFARMDAGGRPDWERAWAIIHSPQGHKRTHVGLPDGVSPKAVRIPEEGPLFAGHQYDSVIGRWVKPTTTTKLGLSVRPEWFRDFRFDPKTMELGAAGVAEETDPDGRITRFRIIEVSVIGKAAHATD